MAARRPPSGGKKVLAEPSLWVVARSGSRVDVADADGSLCAACESSHSGLSPVNFGSHSRRWGTIDTRDLGMAGGDLRGRVQLTLR